MNTSIIKWISITDEKPPLMKNVFGYIPGKHNFVGECYRVQGDDRFYFPALEELHYISLWAEKPTGILSAI